jgi:hypothetical protein
MQLRHVTESITKDAGACMVIHIKVDQNAVIDS